MKIEQIMECIRALAQCQGSYSRFYAELLEIRENDPKRWEGIIELFESKNFKDSVDLVMYLEG